MQNLKARVAQRVALIANLRTSCKYRIIALDPSQQRDPEMQISMPGHLAGRRG